MLGMKPHKARAVADQVAVMSCLADSTRKNCTVGRLDRVAPWVWRFEVRSGAPRLCADIDLKLFETHWNSAGEETIQGARYVKCPNR